MKNKLLVALVLSLFSSMVLAHPAHEMTGFSAGLMHPLTGWDHLLVMLGVGLWAGKLGAGARWKLPLTFMGMMFIGALLGVAGFAFLQVETAIAATVMAMGVLLIIALPFKATIQILLVAIFALMHGLAHGVELVGTTSLFGMLLATGLLHTVGLSLAASRSKMATSLYQAMAWGMMLVGGYWLVA